MIARWVFYVLVFFFAPAWWWGLVVIAVNFFLPFFLPRVNPEQLSDMGRALSGIGSIISDILLVTVYITFFMAN